MQIEVSTGHSKARLRPVIIQKFELSSDDLDAGRNAADGCSHRWVGARGSAVTLRVAQEIVEKLGSTHFDEAKSAMLECTLHSNSLLAPL
jgi:hypothetical protein